MYRAAPVEHLTSETTNSEPAVAGRAGYLDIQFVKIMQQNFATIEDPPASIAGPAGRPGIMAEQKKIIRAFVPFKTALPVSATALKPLYGEESGSDEERTELAGVFFTGDNPCWFLGTDKTGLQTYKAAWSVVNAFTSSDILSSSSDTGREFLVYSEEVWILLILYF